MIYSNLIKTVLLSLVIFSHQSACLKAENLSELKDEFPALKNEIRAAVYISPPFGMYDNSGKLTGLSVECWRSVAKMLDINYRFYPEDMPGLLSGLQENRYDVAIGAITVTPKREELVDFTHPVNPSGTGMAVSTRADRHPFWSLWQLVLINIGELALGLVILLVIFGTIMWIIESRLNPDFRKKFDGIGDGIWWAAVTMTTVGYGDKSPKSSVGRVIAILWMFIGIILISLFTASTSSILTSSKITSTIESKNDLRRCRVGAAAKSSGEEYCLQKEIVYTPYEDVELALQALCDEKLDAVVSNVPVIRHYVLTKYRNGVRVIPKMLVNNNMAMALQKRSPLKEPLNRAILKRTAQRDRIEVLVKYPGEDF